MADWETDWSRDVLERIVALLFSLAGLADLAAGLPGPRRRRLLGVLDVGEVEARAFLIGVSTGAPVPAEAPETAADATRLAARLRALALLLCALLAQTALPDIAGPRPRWRLYSVSGPAVRLLDAPAPLALDTS
jgi:hypothetical protein